MITKRVSGLIILSLLALAFVLRIYRLDLNIPSLYADETAGNYLSWVRFNSPNVDILTKLQTAITSYTWFLGLTPLAARLPSALYGTLAIMALFVLARSLTKDTSVALLTAALGVVVPWLFMLSRISFAQVLIVVILVCLHLALYFPARTVKQYLVSLLPLAIAAYLYPSMIIISPFVAALVIWDVLKIANKKQRLWVSVAAMVFVFGIVVILFGRYGGFSLRSRGVDMAIWRDVNVTADFDLYRGLARLSEPTLFSFGQNTELLANKLLYNYPLSVLHVFIKNYLSFFSPDFLFLKGDTTLRQSTGMVGSFFPVLLPFMIYGGYLLAKSDSRKVKTAFLVWILASPIPGAITKDGPGYLLRVVTIMPFLTYLSAFGIVSFFRDYLSKLKLELKLITILTLTLTLTYSVYSFLFGYFHVYPALSAKNYEYGFKELSDFQMSKNEAPMLVVWDGYYPNLYFRFWQRTQPSEYLRFVPERVQAGGSVANKLFPNLYFSWPRTVGDLDELLRREKILYVAFPADFIKKNPEYNRADKDIAWATKYPDGADDFIVYKSF